MAAKAALRVEKPALSAVQGELEVNVWNAERLEAAQQRLATRQDGAGPKVIDAAPLA